MTTIELGWIPRVLVRVSQLFDSMSDCVVVSFFNVGARLADQVGFQYIAALDADKFASIEAEGFERGVHSIDPILTIGEEREISWP